jgi:serine/threonine-protein kinase HipA
MMRVWSDGKKAGVLDRLGTRGASFAYEPGALADRAVSITMPVRVPSYDSKFGLIPIFEMNLPEGALRERLTRSFAKATGTFDDFDLLQIVGRTQIGRIRYSALNQDLSEEVPFQSIDEILKARRDGELFAYLLEKFAAHSGLSGVQPKVLIRARDEKLSAPSGRRSPSILSATHIVKLWDENEYPELAANEFFCLQVARATGLDVPPFEMSADGGALVLQRFDLRNDHYLGFEDFCVLNALGTAEKYKGGYESRVFRRLRDFVSPSDAGTQLEKLFRLFLVNCAIRNGDAHLKNFGITYSHIKGRVELAPVYDIVTTWAYVPNDPMALTLDGSTRWPDQKALIRLAQTRADMSLKSIQEHMVATADAMSTITPKIRRYFAEREAGVGARMLSAWNTGIKESLGLVKGIVQSSPTKKNLTPNVAPKLAKSDGLLLEYLRQKGGTVSGTLSSIANVLDIPLSTLSNSVKRLVAKGFISRGSKRLSLLPREV